MNIHSHPSRWGGQSTTTVALTTTEERGGSSSAFRMIMGKRWWWSKSGGWSPGSRRQPLNILYAPISLSPTTPPYSLLLPRPHNYHRSPSNLSSRKGISASSGTDSGWPSNNLPPRCMAAGCSPVWVRDGSKWECGGRFRIQSIR